MRPSTKIASALALLAILPILYSGLWYWGALQIEHTLDRESNQWRQQGNELKISERQLRGFPFNPEWLLHDVSFGHGAQNWFGYIEEAVISGPLLGMGGTYEIKLANAALTLAGGKVLSGKKLNLTSNFLPSTFIPDQGKTLLEGEDIDLPMAIGLSNRIDQFSLSSYLDKELSLPVEIPAIEAWRDRGGAWQIDNFIIRQQGLDLKGNMTFAFDQGMQLLAAGVVTGEGLNLVIDQMVTSKKLEPAAGLLLKQVLKQVKGNSNQITSAISIQNNYLYLDGLQLLKLPLVSWTK